MTVTLAALTVASYVVVAALDRSQAAALVGGFIPARVTGMALAGAMPVWLTPLTAALLHGGVLHLSFNLLMLVYCGREDEVALGGGGMVLLYVAGAYAAAAAQFVAGPHSAVPMIGASGAISALVGAYAILYGQRRPSKLSPELARWVHILWLAVTWVVVQALLGLASATVGVAMAASAHVGGFVAGLLLARPLLRWRYRKA
ncbi:rhomboid family intramembrane serine protease [Sphingomonas nostoxanthinifaciens]|nr:rhomboid family intramembrane serine protease [Sphingomonas nostoxanthinifaciens]